MICAGLLLVTGLAKIWSGMGTSKALGLVDPLLGLRFGTLLCLVGLAETAGALQVFLRPRQFFTNAALVAWLSTSFLLYRLGLGWVGWHKPCSCLGNLTDALRLTPAAADSAAQVILACLLTISYGGLFWLGRRTNSSPHGREAKTAAALLIMGCLTSEAAAPQPSDVAPSRTTLGSANAGPADEVAVAAFKAYLSTPPCIERLIYTEQPGCDAKREETFLLAYCGDGFFTRRVTPLDYLDAPISLTNRMHNALLAGQSGDLRWQINGFGVRKSIHAPADQPDACTTFTESLKVIASGIINLGPQKLLPGTFIWKGNDFEALPNPALQPITARGLQPKVGGRIFTRAGRVVRMALHQSRLSYEYEYAPSPGRPDWFPSRIIELTDGRCLRSRRIERAVFGDAYHLAGQFLPEHHIEREVALITLVSNGAVVAQPDGRDPSVVALVQEQIPAQAQRPEARRRVSIARVVLALCLAAPLAWMVRRRLATSRTARPALRAGRGAIFLALYWAFLGDIPSAAGAGAGYWAEGELSFQVGASARSFQSFFRVETSGCKWSIQIREDPYFPFLEESLLASDGTNLFQLDRFSEAAAVGQRTNRYPRVNWNGTVRTGQLPDFDDHHNSSLWLVFASGCYLRASPPNALPGVLLRPRRAGESWLKADYVLEQDAAGNWTCVAADIFDEGRVEMLDGTTVSRPAPFQAGFTNQTYRVTEFRQLEGIRIPGRFRIETYEPKPGARSDSDLSLAWSLNGVVLRAGDLANSRFVPPPIRARTRIEDYRAAALTNVLSVIYYTSTGWLRTNDPAFDTLLTGKPPPPALPPAGRRRLVLSALALSTAAFLAALMMHRNLKHQKKEPQ